MSVINTVKRFLKPSTSSPDRSNPEKEVSKGAYWCDDCDVRRNDLEVESDDPECPECGDEMRFERAAASTGCGCC